MPDDRTTRDQIQRFQCGDEEAFDLLMHAHARTAFELAYRLLGHAQDAEDVCQAAWLRLFHSLRDFEPRARFSTYLYQTVLNACRDRWRRTRHSHVAFDDHDMWLEDPHPTPLESAQGQEEKRQVREAILDLPETERECVVLCHYHALTIADVARITRRPRTTVQSTLTRGFDRLSRRLAETGSRELPGPCPSSETCDELPTREGNPGFKNLRIPGS